MSRGTPITPSNVVEQLRRLYEAAGKRPLHRTSPGKPQLTIHEFNRFNEMSDGKLNIKMFEIIEPFDWDKLDE